MRNKNAKFLRELNFRLAVGISDEQLTEMIPEALAIIDKLIESQNAGIAEVTPSKFNKGAYAQLRNWGLIDLVDIEKTRGGNTGTVKLVDPENAEKVREYFERQLVVNTKTENKQEVIGAMHWRGDGTGGCIICGNSDPSSIEFHHINPDSQSPLWQKSNSKQSVLAQGWSELPKTVPMCDKCHNGISEFQNLYGMNAPLPYELRIPRERLQQYWENCGRELVMGYFSRMTDRTKEPILKEIPRGMTVSQYFDSTFLETLDHQSPEATDEEKTTKLDSVATSIIRDANLLTRRTQDQIEQIRRNAGENLEPEQIERLNKRIENLKRLTDQLNAEGLAIAKEYVGTLNVENSSGLFDQIDSAFEQIQMQEKNTEKEKNETVNLNFLLNLKQNLEQQLLNTQNQIQELEKNRNRSTVLQTTAKEKFIQLQSAIEQEQQLVEDIEALEEEIMKETEILNQEIQEISQSNQELQQQSKEAIMPQEQAAESSPEEMMAMLQQSPGQAPMSQEMPINPSQMQAPPQPPPTPEELAQLKKQRTKEKEDAPLSNLDPDEQAMAQELAMAAQAQAAAGAPPGGPPPPTSKVKKSYSIHDELKNSI
jgi:hypothetical protein